MSHAPTLDHPAALEYGGVEPILQTPSGEIGVAGSPQLRRSDGIEVLPPPHEPDVDASVFATHLALPGDRWFTAARRVEQAVFAETFGMSAVELEAEYAPYDEHSLFVAVEDCTTSSVVGCARVVLPGPRSLKTFTDAEKVWGVNLETSARQLGVPLNESGTWDVATLSVHPEYRRGTVSLGLYQGICTTARAAGAQWLVAGLDVAVLRLLQLRLARGFSPFPGIEPRHYVGSLSTIVWADTAQWHRQLKARHPQVGDVVFEGASLAPALAPPHWASSLSRIAGLFPPPSDRAARRASS